VVAQTVSNGSFCRVLAACVVGFSVLLSISGFAAEKDPGLAEATAELKRLGLSVQARSLVTREEQELRRRLATEKKLRKETDLRRKALDELLEKDSLQQSTHAQLRLQHRQLNARLAQARNVNENNQLVAAMNELGHQVEQLSESRQHLSGQIQTRRAEYAEKRDEYISNILEAREAATAAEAAWKALPTRDDVKAAVEKYNEFSDRPIALAPSRALATQIRLLSRLEKTVLADAIPLKRDGGGTFQVDVVVNNKRSMAMVVDSGASLVCLPYEDAVAAKLDLESTAEPIILMIADGTQVKANRIVIPTLRVGQFAAEKVEAAVLPPEMANAPALLGMSFLRNFQVSIDSDSATLKMSQLKDAEPNAAN
jgi:aspartyl protease family protein